MTRASRRALRAGVDAARTNYRSSLRENRYEYGLTMNAGEAAAAAATGAMSQYARGAAGVSAAALRGLRAQVAAAKRTSRATAAAQAATVNRYGSAMGGVAATAYAPAAARAGASVAKTAAAVGQGRADELARATAAGIAQTGLSAQQSAAEFAFAQALQARNSVSAETFANLTGQMYQTALQYQQQWDLWKKQQEYAKKQADQAQQASVVRLTNEAPQIAADAGDIIRQNVTGEEGQTYADFQPGVQATAWAQANGYGDAEAQLMAAALRNMQNAGRNGQPVLAGPAMTAAITTLYGDAKGFDKWGDALLSSVASGTDAEWTARYAAYQNDATNSSTYSVPGQTGSAAETSSSLGPTGDLQHIGGDLYRNKSGILFRKQADGSYVPA